MVLIHIFSLIWIRLTTWVNSAYEKQTFLLCQWSFNHKFLELYILMWRYQMECEYSEDIQPGAESA